MTMQTLSELTRPAGYLSISESAQEHGPLLPGRVKSDAPALLRSDRPELIALVSPRAIELLVQCCRRSSPRVKRFSSAGCTLDAQLLAHDGPSSSGLALKSDSEVPRGGCQVLVNLLGVSFVLEARTAGRESDRAELYELEQLRWFTFDRRAQLRVGLSCDAARLIWTSMEHDGLRVREARMLDFTPDGVGIAAPEDDAIPEGTFDACLRLEGFSLQCSAELRRRYSQYGKTASFGLKLAVESHEKSLTDLYIERRFPKLKPRHLVAPAELQRMMEVSGYLKLRSGEGVSESWHRFSAPSSQSCDVAYEGHGGKVVGHISATRAYARTWVFHQLASWSSRVDEALECRSSMYDFVSSIPRLMSGERAMALAYFDRAKRWHHLFFEDFVHWMNSPLETTIEPFDRFERSAPRGAGHARRELPSGWSIGVPTRPELVAATGLARAQLSVPMANAIGLQPWSLRSQDLLSSGGASRLSRTREALVLRAGTEIMGVALCETGDRDLSLFNLFNLAQVFLRKGDASPPLSAQLALLESVRAFYQARGVDDPLVIAPPNTFRAPEDSETILAETMGCVVMTAKAIRQWENYCRFHFGNMKSRRGSI